MKAFKEQDTIDNAYLDKAIVYLESEEDIQILKERWFFDEGRYVEFKSADSGSGGGCTQVIKRVEFDRSKGVKAFGIVDRDALLQCCYWDEWWEVDDRAFAILEPLGTYVKVLKRWEIENYLLTPTELEIVLADKEFRSTRNSDVVIRKLLSEAENVKLLSAASVYCHEKGLSFPRGMGTNKSNQELFKILDLYLEKNLNNYEKKCLINYIDKIESFAEGISGNVPKRWERLNRLLDGKLMLRRLGLYGKSFLDRRGDLARHVRINRKIDSEITSILEYCKEAGKH